jgi:DNA-binding NtrC family response regulator
MARSPVPVVITGPSGTGKEMVARSIHTLSERRGAYVPVNCAAIAPTLLESELFGHKKGAFSGAQEDRPGLLRAAHEGTLFLDEIADMPLPAQAAVLRALQEGEVLPVGSTRAVPVQLRVLSATHGHLEKLAEEGKFRSDLRARLSGFAVDLPALRARREDMGLLISALLRRSKVPGASTATIAPAVMRCVLAYDWPLNVRELEKVLTSALVLAAGSRVEWDHLPAAVQSSRAVVHGSRLAGESAWPSSHASSTDVRGAVPVASERDGTVPREFLQERLRFHHGNVSAVARELGKARMQIQRWIRRYSIDVEAMRS